MKIAYATVTGDPIPGTNRERNRRLRLYLDKDRNTDGTRDWNSPSATFGAGRCESERLVEWLHREKVEILLHSSSVDDSENWQFGRVYRAATRSFHNE
jgi:hypothetical protein